MGILDTILGGGSKQVAEAYRYSADLQRQTFQDIYNMMAHNLNAAEQKSLPWREAGLRSLSALDNGLRSGAFIRPEFQPGEFRPASPRATRMGLVYDDHQEAPQNWPEPPAYGDVNAEWARALDIPRLEPLQRQPVRPFTMPPDDPASPPDPVDPANPLQLTDTSTVGTTDTVNTGPTDTVKTGVTDTSTTGTTDTVNTGGTDTSVINKEVIKGETFGTDNTDGANRPIIDKVNQGGGDNANQGGGLTDPANTGSGLDPNAPRNIRVQLEKDGKKRIFQTNDYWLDNLKRNHGWKDVTQGGADNVNQGGQDNANQGSNDDNTGVINPNTGGTDTTNQGGTNIISQGTTGGTGGTNVDGIAITATILGGIEKIFGGKAQKTTGTTGPQKGKDQVTVTMPDGRVFVLTDEEIEALQGVTSKSEANQKGVLLPGHEWTIIGDDGQPKSVTAEEAEQARQNGQLVNQRAIDWKWDYFPDPIRTIIEALPVSNKDKEVLSKGARLILDTERTVLEEIAKKIFPEQMRKDNKLSPAELVVEGLAAIANPAKAGAHITRRVLGRLKHELTDKDGALRKVLGSVAEAFAGDPETMDVKTTTEGTPLQNPATGNQDDAAVINRNAGKPGSVKTSTKGKSLTPPGVKLDEVEVKGKKIGDKGGPPIPEVEVKGKKIGDKETQGQRAQKAFKESTELMKSLAPSARQRLTEIGRYKSMELEREAEKAERKIANQEINLGKLSTKEEKQLEEAGFTVNKNKDGTVSIPGSEALSPPPKKSADKTSKVIPKKGSLLDKARQEDKKKIDQAIRRGGRPDLQSMTPGQALKYMNEQYGSGNLEFKLNDKGEIEAVLPKGVLL